MPLDPNRSPLRFPPANGTPVDNPGVPIVGQPATIETLSVTASFVCNCDARPRLAVTLVAVVGVGNSSTPITCPGCQKTYIVKEGSNVNIALSIIVPPRGTSQENGGGNAV